VTAEKKAGDALRRITEVLGGTRVLAIECDVSTWTARAWLSGARRPAPASQRRINELASDLGVELPYPDAETGVRRRKIDDG